MGVDLEPSCFSVAAGSDQAKCAEELGTYLDICESGPCGGATGSGSGGPVCSSLAACCPLLTGGNVSECNEVSADGEETVCASYLGFAQANGSCN
jgi:hypothetical protein